MNYKIRNRSMEPGLQPPDLGCKPGSQELALLYNRYLTLTCLTQYTMSIMEPQLIWHYYLQKFQTPANSFKTMKIPAKTGQVLNEQHCLLYHSWGIVWNSPLKKLSQVPRLHWFYCPRLECTDDLILLWLLIHWTCRTRWKYYKMRLSSVIGKLVEFFNAIKAITDRRFSRRLAQ